MRMTTVAAALVLALLVGAVAYELHLIRRGFSARNNPSATGLGSKLGVQAFYSTPTKVTEMERFNPNS
jgi:hypothetical protein